MTTTTGTYLVECFWPGVTPTTLVSTLELAAANRSATCLEVILVPDDDIVLCLFEAWSEPAVLDASRRAGFAPERVVKSVRVQSRRNDHPDALEDPATGWASDGRTATG